MICIWLSGVLQKGYFVFKGMALNVSLHFGPQWIFLEKRAFQICWYNSYCRSFFHFIPLYCSWFAKHRSRHFSKKGLLMCVFIHKNCQVPQICWSILNHQLFSFFFLTKCPLILNWFYFILPFSNFIFCLAACFFSPKHPVLFLLVRVRGGCYGTSYVTIGLNLFHKQCLNI